MNTARPDQCRLGERMADDYFQHAADCPECEAHEAARVAPAPVSPTREQRLEAALRGIIELGKRDLSNQKYDGYFDDALAALEQEPQRILQEKNDGEA